MSKIRRPVEEMLPVADRLIAQLGPGCRRIALAGSIRRGEAMVGDIELVCQPAGDKVEAVLADLLRMGRIEKRKKSNGHFLAWGPRYKAFDFSGVPVDLFIVLPDRQWGPTFLIRTGPQDANQALVTTAGTVNANGYAGVLPRGLKFRDGGVWKSSTSPQTSLESGEGLQKVDTPEEVDVFRACGLPYVPPVLRSYELYRALEKEGMPPFPKRWLDGRDDIFVQGQRKVMVAPVADDESVVETMVQERLL